MRYCSEKSSAEMEIKMTFQEAYEKLEAAGQTHVLQHYNSLTQEEKDLLLDQIELTDFSVLASVGRKEELTKRGKITPLAAMETAEIDESGERFTKTGLQTIRAGKVGAVLRPRFAEDFQEKSFLYLLAHQGGQRRRLPWVGDRGSGAGRASIQSNLKASASHLKSERFLRFRTVGDPARGTG